MEFLSPVAAFLSLPLFLAGFTWYAVRARRSGGGQSLMAPFEEIWDPIAHHTNIEIQIEGKRAPQTPSPGDPPVPSAGVVPRQAQDASTQHADSERRAANPEQRTQDRKPGDEPGQ